MLSSAPLRRSTLPISNETSAGGIAVDITTGVPRAPIIARRNRAGRLEWCLPKGHLEGKETAEEAAVREIAEETGITSEVLNHLGSIDYWFDSTKHRIHKVVHHFLLRALGGELTADNDPDGEAEEVEWVSLSRLDNRLAYPNERKIARLAAELWEVE